jgi:hypothetical protein
MSERQDKQFDCVDAIRDMRTQLSEEMSHATTFEERLAWLRAIQYSDPFLQHLQHEATQKSVRRAGLSEKDPGLG